MGFQGPQILKIYQGNQQGQGLIGNLQSLATTNEMKTGFLIPQNKTLNYRQILSQYS